MKNRYVGLLRKNGITLDYVNQSDKTSYGYFLESIPDGELVEIYMEKQSDDGTLAQLAKVHAMIRELAIHIGETFEDMKLLVKKRAGLCIEKEIEGERFLHCKSLGKCNKQELALCIEAMKQIGEAIDYSIS
jgi:hypothetical protein